MDSVVASHWDDSAYTIRYTMNDSSTTNPSNVSLGQYPSAGALTNTQIDTSECLAFAFQFASRDFLLELCPSPDFLVRTYFPYVYALTPHSPHSTPHSSLLTPALVFVRVLSVVCCMLY